MVEEERSNMDFCTKMIRSFPELNIKALNQKKTREYRFWLLLSHFDRERKGEGRFPLKDFIDWILENEIASYETARATLKNRETFWQVYIRPRDNLEMIRLLGQASVAKVLGVSKLTRQPVFIPLEAFRKLRTFRSYLAASFFRDEWSRPISRSTFSQLTNYSSETLRSWEKANPNWSHRENWLLLPGGPETYFTESELKSSKRGKYIDDRWVMLAFLDHHWTVVRQIGNSYQSVLNEGSGSTLRERVNRKLESLSSNAGLIFNHKNRGEKSRLYWVHSSSPRALARAFQSLRNEDRIRVELPTKGFQGEAGLWSEYTRCDGAILSI